jgi:SPP1 family predicted phage head-tail adaptor
MNPMLAQRITLMPRVDTDDDSIDGDTHSWVDGVTVPAQVDPVDQSELTAGRDTSEADVIAYIDPGPMVDAHDRFRWDGKVYSLVGPPAEWLWPGYEGLEVVALKGRRIEG